MGGDFYSLMKVCMCDLSLASFLGHFSTQKGRCQTPDVCVNCCDTCRICGLAETMNASQQIHFSLNRRVESAIIASVFALIFVLSMVGNCLVLAVLLRNGQMNAKTTNMFILNLGLADLCFILFCVPLQATIYAMDEWVFGAFVCKAVHFIIYLTMYASIFTLTAVSLDRYVLNSLHTVSRWCKNYY